MDSPHPIDRNSWTARIASVTILVISLAVGTSSLIPPAPKPIDVPASEFSAERAMLHVREIARTPRPAGSEQAKLAREYLAGQLRDLGWDVSIRTVPPPDDRWGQRYAKELHNIVAIRRGASSTGMIALVSHYDSVSTAPGAGDAAAGCATLIETARALSSVPELRNDLMILITDGEEPGLLGAKSFVQHDPQSRSIDITLNFDARGSRGVAYMFETSEPNAWLIEQLRQTVRLPACNSLSWEIYSRLPNSTDFAVLKRVSAGMNFAFIGGFEHYHQPTDTAERISLRSLQHCGDYALPLARHFAQLDLRATRPQGNVIYFTPARGWLVAYPQRLMWPLASGALVVFLAALFVSIRGKLVTLRGVILSFAIAIGLIVLPAALIFLVNQILTKIHAGGLLTRAGGTRGAEWYAIAYAMIGFAVLCYASLLSRRDERGITWAITSSLILMTLAVASCVWVPGASFVATWSALSVSIAWLLAAMRAHASSAWICQIAGTFVPTVILAPLLAALLEALTITRWPAVGAAMGLWLVVLMPHLQVFSARTRKLAGISLAALAIGCIVFAARFAG